MTSVRLPTHLEGRLAQLARDTKRTKSYFIIEALEHYLDDIEDYSIAMDRVKRPERRTLSSEEMVANWTHRNQLEEQ